ncbi:protein disulfide-isomerase A5-like [Ruditapes philippinarum]|uniref:protein disulfide-isomerase A5-like n=1 Tax=Ruditapes philippinarum TaxID=129788 RepID=UPI00295C3A5E|nr:protein disulfide-isomerase A5-like [Ruditapes philippinarum]
MHRLKALIFVPILVILFIPSGAKKGKSLILELDDLKEFKKTLRTKTNLLVAFAKSDNAASKQMSLLEDLAEEIKGKGTVAFVDCSEAKKLCKNLKVSPSPLELRHYKDGDFNKNYDRKMVKKSLVNFMYDPTGDIPWDEEAGAEDVVHVESEQGFNKLLKKGKYPILAMFYAPWCGFCKRLKPDFAAAATELKGQVIMAGIDVDKPQQMALRAQYNITGFPTLYYFEGGKLKYKYGGENNKEGLVKWLKNPSEPEEPKPETQWEDEAPEVAHLHDNTWEDFMSTHGSVLVMFYAPWCGHCKKMKPEYQEAAQTMKAENIEGQLAAVDVTIDKKLGDQFSIKGFPTVKYFKNGVEEFDFNERTADKIVDFMRDPKEPPPPPEPEKSWEETESDVVHLTDDDFKPVLKKKKHALVMFYAPWCGHCKKAKPEYMSAAAQFKDDTKVMFAAMDCTIHRTSCTAHDVSGYPTFKYFNYGKNAQKYMGGREEPDFIKFMKDPLNTEPEPSKPPSPSPEEHWSDVTGFQNVAFPSGDNFENFIKEHNSVLVMFYAPWCGHCKAMKPAYGEAATLLKQENHAGILAAVDATIDNALASKYEVRGYPTLKYFKNGKFAFDYGSGRSTDNLVAFMKNPKEPGPPPEAEPAWDTVKSAVNHLTGDNFSSFTASKDAVLVMFYAPWCGHCKKAKPSYQGAADKLGDSRRALAAVDCTAAKSKDLCSKEGIKGFPTIKLYVKGQFLVEYSGDRTEEEFFKFIMNAPTVKEEL